MAAQTQFVIGSSSANINLSNTTGSNLVQLMGGTNVVTSGNHNDSMNIFAGSNTIYDGNGNDFLNLYNAAYSSSPDTDYGAPIRLGIELRLAMQ